MTAALLPTMMKTHGPGSGTTDMERERDVEAISAASNFVRHGTPHGGGSFPDCVCPKQRCGGIAENDELDHCPEHALTPVQQWHWAAECPTP